MGVMKLGCLVLSTLSLLSGCATRAPQIDGLTPTPDGPTPHTRRFDPSQPCHATVADLEFLVGRWVGEALGGVAEEAWNPALGGELLGTFRLVQADKTIFSELMVLSVEGERVVMRLKHFSHPGLVAWEDKEESVAFPLIAVEGQTAWFGGLTIQRSGDRLDFALAMGQRDGASVEERFQLRRVR